LPAGELGGAPERLSLVTTHSRDRARGLVLLASFIGLALSVFLWFRGSEMQGIFVGLWVPSILALGALVIPKEEGSR